MSSLPSLRAMKFKNLYSPPVYLFLRDQECQVEKLHLNTVFLFSGTIESGGCIRSLSVLYKIQHNK